MSGSRSQKPLVLEDFFSGPVVAEGAFLNLWLRSRRGIKVDIAPSWDGRVLILDERFVYSNGEMEHRVWKLERTEPGIFSGTRGDIVGTARIWTVGNAVHLKYVLLLLGIGFSFDETMILCDDGSVLGRASVRKWGLPIGRVELVMRRV